MMTWSKVKPITIVMVALLTGGEIAVAIPQTTISETLTPSEISQRVQDAYQLLSSYSDEGSVVFTRNGTTTWSTEFKIKLARPDYYRIEWRHSDTRKGVVWSAGDSHFVTLDDLETREFHGNYDLLIPLGAVSESAAAIPLTFFNIYSGIQLINWANARQQADEKLGTIDCYVFASESKIWKKTFWIGKHDFLIHQIQTVINNTPPGSTGANQKSALQSTSSIETHFNIELNKQFSTTDLGR